MLVGAAISRPRAVTDRPLQILTDLFVGANCVRPPTIILQITLLVSINILDLYLQRGFEKRIIVKKAERQVVCNEKQRAYFWRQLFNL